MKDKIQLQREEFDAVQELSKQMRRIELTMIVDDDYPAVRHDYERAVREIVEAFKANGRHNSQEHHSEVIQFCGFLTAELKELHRTHPDKLRQAWHKFLEAKMRS